MALINATDVQIGSLVKNTAGTQGVAASALYADTNGNLASGGVVPFISGITNTAAAFFSVEGSSTNTANDLMHQSLVAGANVTTATKQAFLRVTLTDDAGNITNGDYYIQLNSLS